MLNKNQDTPPEFPARKLRLIPAEPDRNVFRHPSSVQVKKPNVMQHTATVDNTVLEYTELFSDEIDEPMSRSGYVWALSILAVSSAITIFCIVKIVEFFL